MNEDIEASITLSEPGNIKQTRILNKTDIEIIATYSKKEYVEKIAQKVLLNAYNNDMLTSLLQIITNMTILIDEYLSLELFKNTFPYDFQSLLQTLVESKQLYDPASFIALYKPIINDFTLPDLIHFMMHIIDPVCKYTQFKQLTNAIPPDHDFINKNFTMTIRNTLKCTCNTIMSQSTSTTSIHRLTFDDEAIKKIQNVTTNFKKIFVEKPLKTKEKICELKHIPQQNCSYCNNWCTECQTNTFVSENTIVQLPEYIIITIESTTKGKNVKIAYDEKIYLKDHVATNKECISKYELFAMIKNEIEEKTFVPIIKSNNQWYAYDHLRKTRLKVFNTNSSLVTALFYQKKR